MVVDCVVVRGCFSGAVVLLQVMPLISHGWAIRNIQTVTVWKDVNGDGGDDLMLSSRQEVRGSH